MRVWTVGGDLTAGDIAEAIAAEFAPDGRFGVACLRCWTSEPVGKIFCLVEAEDLDLMAALRRRSRRPIAEEIYPVSEHARLGPGITASDLDHDAAKGHEPNWAEESPGCGHT